MKSFRKELWFNVPSRRGFINITREVEDCFEEHVQDRMVIHYPRH